MITVTNLTWKQMKLTRMMSPRYPSLKPMVGRLGSLIRRHTKAQRCLFSFSYSSAVLCYFSSEQLAFLSPGCRNDGRNANKVSEETCNQLMESYSKPTQTQLGYLDGLASLSPREEEILLLLVLLSQPSITDWAMLPYPAMVS